MTLEKQFDEYNFKHPVGHNGDIIEDFKDEILEFCSYILEQRDKEIMSELQKIVDEPNIEHSWHKAELESFINLITNTNK